MCNGLAGPRCRKESMAVEAEPCAINVRGEEQMPGTPEGRHDHLHVGQGLPPWPVETQRNCARCAEDYGLQPLAPDSSAQLLNQACNALLERRVKQPNHVDVNVSLGIAPAEVGIVCNEACQHHSADDAQIAPVNGLEDAMRTAVEALQECFLSGHMGRLGGHQGRDEELAVSVRDFHILEFLNTCPHRYEVCQIISEARLLFTWMFAGSWLCTDHERRTRNLVLCIDLWRQTRDFSLRRFLAMHDLARQAISKPIRARRRTSQWAL
mmetsp:Transcript_31761/g.91278  ORF Transcript_31761/g.91278 Transcript_31761/m.91278 type:complete len:267 (-) Transcript_31761:1461-2261(-)